MPGKIKQGQSIFIPFRNGMSISDSQNKARMYMSVEKFKASFPAFRLGTEDVELVEYAPVRQGHWEIHCLSNYDSWTQETDENFYLECSECKRQFWDVDQIAAMNSDGKKLIEKYPYCHCGCKMEGVRDV